MGTRGAFGVRIDGTDKVSYNHFDSYPEGLGANIVNQLNDLINSHGIDGIKAMARDLRMVSEDETPTDVDVKRLSGFANLAVSKQSTSDWYCLLREAQGQLDVLLRDAKVMIDSRDFLLDSLFCEYAYIANLDTEVLEVYRGFQTTQPSRSRYKGRSRPDAKYYAVELVAEYPLSALPDIKTMEQAIDEFDGNDENEVA